MLVSAVFIITAALIYVGFLANYFFDVIKVPDSPILIFLGILFGPVANALWPHSIIAQIFNPEAFQSCADIRASLAILVIMFETGMSMDVQRVIKEAPRSFYYATAHYFTTALLGGVLAALLFQWNWTLSFMLGFLLGGTSAAIVIPLGKRLGLDPKEQTLLELESTITNIYNVVFVLAFAQFLITPNPDWTVPIKDILSAFSISIVFGILIGYGWEKVLKKLSNQSYSYMLTFATLLLFYSLMQEFGGNGPLFALVFGMVLTNLHIVSPLRMVNMIQLHREITFFIRVFFFVFLGVIFSPTMNPAVWAFAILLSLISLGARYLAAKLMELEDPFRLAILLPRGLGEAVLSALIMVLLAGTQYSGAIDTILQAVSATIIWTNIFSAALVAYYMHKNGVDAEQQPVTVPAPSQ
jgi:cell volume regulation protein A